MDEDMDISDNPFQMDEELSYSAAADVSGYRDGNQPPPQKENQHDESTNKQDDVETDFERLKMRDGSISPVEREEEAFEEDFDDKLDVERQEQLEQEYLLHLGMDEPLTPPENFAPVINKIYRSSFPQPNNFSFLKKLKLKSILCLIPEDYPQLHAQFIKKENMKLFQLGMSGNKEPFVKISSELITEAVKIVLDPTNQPILIHCNRGKHRTGCLVGIIRRLQKWSLTIIFDEYRKFASPKERAMDQQFIELYDESQIVKFAESNGFLPLSWD